MTNDEMVRIAAIQKEIESYVGMGNNNVIFDFQERDGKTALDVVTVNARHHQSFLFHTTNGPGKVQALETMLDYVKNYKQKEDSYTIQWTLKGDNELHTSYFRAKNIIDALDKLYYGRDANSVTVFSVTLNPLA